VTTGESRFDRWRRTAETAAASAGEARVRVIRDLATALAVLVRRVRIPLLVVGLLPLTPALVLALDELAAELAQAYDVAGAWAKAGDALQRVRSAGPGLRGAGRAARGVWAGVQLTKELFDRFSDLPRVAPFLPIRLQFTGYLCLASLVATAVLIILVVATTLVLAAGAVT